MSDSQSEKPSSKPDRWKMIANLLGLSVPEAPAAEPVAEEPAAVVEPTPSETGETQPVAPPPARPAARKPEPKPKREAAPRRASWVDLCGELGIELPPEPAPEAPAPEPETPKGMPAATSPAAAKPAWDKPSHRDVDDAPRAAFLGAELSALENVEDEPDVFASVEEVEFTEELEEVTSDDVASDEVANDEAVIDEVASDEDEASDEPGETSALLRRRRRRRRRRGGSGGRDEAADRDESPKAAEAETRGGFDREELEADVAAEAPEVDSSDEAEGDEEESDRGGERRRRPRRRRRRSGRRDTAAVEKVSDNESSVDGALDDDDDDDEVDVNLALDDDDDDDDDLPVRHGRGDEGRRGGDASSRSKHKKIPTWEEAISVIVSANMETRRRDGNSGRNRPRGGGGGGGGSRRRGRGSSDRRG